MSEERALPDWCPGPRLESMFEAHLATHEKDNGMLNEIRSGVKGIYLVVKGIVVTGAMAAAISAVLILLEKLGG